MSNSLGINALRHPLIEVDCPLYTLIPPSYFPISCQEFVLSSAVRIRGRRDPAKEGVVALFTRST